MTKIFQIYYDNEQLPTLDTGFIPYDNTSNLKPDLREWYIMDKEYQSMCDQNIDFWGFFSWKFKDKTNLSSIQVNDWIAKNPGYDVYMFNGPILQEAAYINEWVQGEVAIKGLIDAGRELLNKGGYNVDFENMITTSEHIVFCSFIVGSRKFWDEYMDFSRKLFNIAISDESLTNKLFEYKIDYNPGPIPIFSFVFERLITTFIKMTNVKCLSYQYTQETVHPMYYQYFQQIVALSQLKKEIIKYNSSELLDIYLAIRYTIYSSASHELIKF